MKCTNCKKHNLTERGDILHCEDCGYFKRNEDGSLSPTSERPPAPKPEPTPEPKPEPKPKADPPKAKDNDDEPAVQFQPFDLEDI